MYTFTMVGCTLFKLCHCKCAKAYLLEILGMSRLWHVLLAHGLITTQVANYCSYKTSAPVMVDTALEKQPVPGGGTQLFFR